MFLEQHLMNVFPEPSPNINPLRKESLKLGICGQLWAAVWFALLPFCLQPILGSCDQQHNITFRLTRKLQKSYF